MAENAAQPRRVTRRRGLDTMRRWIDSSARMTETDPGLDDRVDWLRALPFIAMHLACLGVLRVGMSATAVWVALALYAVRMFALTGFYHRYFSHRAFRTSRPMQFVFALLGAASVQRGPLWWAAHHRHHHVHADTAADPHTPRKGFWRSHAGWFLTRGGFRTDPSRIGDLLKFPELRWLDRYDTAVPVALAVALYAVGAMLKRWAPGLGTSGPQLLVWGFFVSTVLLFHATVTINSLAHRWGPVLLFHATVTINSLAHRWGRRRFVTRDESRNNLWLALLTFGEGWHNNHHFYPGSARQGFRWWEIDLTWYGLRAMQALGLIRDLKPIPAWVLTKAVY